MTIGVEFASRIVSVDHDVNVKLQIWDTAGQENFRSITRSYYRGSICCLLCYDITRRNSFANCIKWIEDIMSHSYDKIVILLVGNKTDLADRRQVSFEEGQKFARDNGLIFFETSALDGNNVESAFIRGATEVYEGVLMNRFDKDEFGDVVGVKAGNTEMTDK